MGKVTRRDFIVKGGKYALFTGTAMQVLFTSKRAMAQSGLAQFVVNVLRANIGSFSGPPSTSPSGTWTGSQYNVQYEMYSIAFTGDTSLLPNDVDVTVRWDGRDFNSAGGTGDFSWDDSGSINGSHAFSVPKATGLSIGNGSAGVGSFVPHARNEYPGTRTGTVTFTATGVQTLTISVVMPIHGSP